MSTLEKRLKIDRKEVEGGRCIRSDGKLCFNEKERCKFWKDYIETIKKKKNKYDHAKGDAVEGCVDHM